MKKSLILLTFVAILAVMSYGQTAADHIKAGDDAYALLDDQKALDHYLEALKVEPENYEALWKVSRAYVDIADVITATDKDAKQRQMKMYTDATAYAKKAIAANPNDTWGHFQYAAAFGQKLLRLGTKEQIDGSKQIRAEIDKAIELDPNNDLAYHALGRWHRRIAEIGGATRFFGSLLYGSIPKGSFEESEKNLKKAVEIKPDYVNHHLELGNTYVDLKKYDLAAQEFQKAIDLPKTTSKDDVLKKEAQTELAKIKNKIK
ncbi:MAG: tetratricopeptide repeat protein [Candidatus Aminicenantales bacterium]